MLVYLFDILLLTHHCTPGLGPTRPWQRVHIDFAGQLFCKTYLIVTPNGLKSGKYRLHLHLQQLMFHDTFFQFSVFPNNSCQIVGCNLHLMILKFFFVKMDSNISNQLPITLKPMMSREISANTKTFIEEGEEGRSR